ncbi:helix-turn-helix domain-containing protein [Candidatus Poribacteria bacterium]
MIGKNVDEIIEQDLQYLVNNSVLESKTIEYKQALSGNSDSEKKEFLADVSSFANASGGDLIYGINVNSDTGEPESLDGLAVQNVDNEIARLENMIRDGIRPRISSVTVRSINLSNTNVVLIIRIPRSWNIPHRVIFKGHDKFYGRNSNGKYPLDVGELRTMFNLSETLAEKIRNFRENRISTIVANEGPVFLVDNPKIVLHLIPMSSFSPGQRYDISIAVDLVKRMELMNWSGWYYRYNLDGFLTHTTVKEEGAYNYMQLHKNGIIEKVDGRTIGKEKSLPNDDYEQKLMESLKACLAFMSNLSVEVPILLFLSLLDVKECRMQFRGFLDQGHAIDRDMLVLPEVIVEDYDMPVGDILKPCFDSIWNACGFARCFNYDEEGKRIK